MISEAAVYGTSAAVYAAATVVFLLWLRRVPDGRRLYYRLATLVVGVGAVSSALMVLGVGVVPVNGYAVTLPTFASDLVAYSVLWGIAAMLADVDRRTLALVAGLPAVQVLAFQAAPIFGGVVTLASAVVVIGGHLVLAAVFIGRIWPATVNLPEERRLLHWKARNLLLFLIGMLVAFAFLSVVGAFDAFGTVVLNQYVSVLIRVGFAGFLFANAGALADGPSEGAVGSATATTAD